MQAIILAAGEGSRMRPLTFSRPKPMIPIANKPIMEHLILESSLAGVDEFVVVVGHKQEVIRDYFEDGSKWNVRIDYCWQEKPLGTADAIKRVRGTAQEKFLVMNGDVIVKKDEIAKLAASKRMTMAVKTVEDVTGLGVVETTGNFIKSINEKPEQPTSKIANTGVYFLTEEIFPILEQVKISTRGQYELTSALSTLIGQGIEISYQEVGSWINLTYPWDLLSANQTLLGELISSCGGVVENGVTISGSCQIGTNTRLRSGTYIVGPVVIGQNCDIGPNCYIRPSTAIGDRCHIGGSVEVKNSIIMSDTKIPHQSYVGDSIIGENCNLGAGTKIANLRFDHKNIKVGGFDTGRRKFGAVLGDAVQTGVNVILSPGTIIGNDTLVWPGVTVHGKIESDSRISCNS